MDVLGITIASGNVWRDEGVQHTLRMLELVGRTGVPVVPGAVFPLVRTQAGTRAATPLIGPSPLAGRVGKRPPDLALPAVAVLASDEGLGPWDVPPLPEGSPRTKPLAEDAAHFLIRQVRSHPGEVTIYGAGPLTNVALAIAIEPRFAEMTRGIVIMGSGLSPQRDDRSSSPARATSSTSGSTRRRPASSCAHPGRGST